MKTPPLYPQAEGEKALVRISRKVNFLLKHNAIADANDIVFYFNSWKCN